MRQTNHLEELTPVTAILRNECCLTISADRPGVSPTDLQLRKNYSMERRLQEVHIRGPIRPLKMKKTFCVMPFIQSSVWSEWIPGLVWHKEMNLETALHTVPTIMADCLTSFAR